MTEQTEKPYEPRKAQKLFARMGKRSRLSDISLDDCRDPLPDSARLPRTTMTSEQRRRIRERNIGPEYLVAKVPEPPYAVDEF